MTAKQEILNYAKQNGFIYPKFKVMFSFGLGGGAVSGLTVWFFIWVSALFLEIFTTKHNIISIKDIFSVIFSAPLFALFGIGLGIVPALLTGIYLSIRQSIIIDSKDYLKLLIVGGLISVISILIIAFFNNQEVISIKDFGDILVFLSIFVLGGISTMICGKFFLPKLPKDFKNR